MLGAEYLEGTFFAREDIVNLKKDHSRRVTVAAIMTGELTQFGLMIPGFAGFVPQAIQELWSFVDNP